MRFEYLIYYLLFINLVGVIINIADKSRAKAGKWRVSEKSLWLVALLGGALGSYVTMQIIRHKTKHLSFMVGLPILIILQLIIIVLFIVKTGLI